MTELSTIQASSPVRMVEYTPAQQRAVEASAASPSSQLKTDSGADHSQRDSSGSPAGKQETSTNALDAFIESTQRLIHFAIDKESRRTIIKIVDPRTKEVIRQIPPEDALKISRMVSQLYRDRGLVTDERI